MITYNLFFTYISFSYFQIKFYNLDMLAGSYASLGGLCTNY